VVNAYQRGLEPLFFWHLQKMGGSSFCGMNRLELKFRGQPLIQMFDNCNFVSKKGNAFKFAVEGRRMVPPLPPWSVLGMEPAYVYEDEFPEAYHREMRNILDTNTVDPFWITVPQAIAVRSPEQSAMSAFDYVFASSQVPHRRPSP